MDPATIAMLAATAYSAYSASKGQSSAVKGQQEANLGNVLEAQKNRDFQERMTRNKHQYEVQDLIAAGLNPILSATAGAAVPSGSTAQVQSTQSHIPTTQIAKQQLLANIASTAQDINLKKEMANTETTKQTLNNAKAKEAGGTVGIPGILKTPIASAKRVYDETIAKIKKSNWYKH